PRLGDERRLEAADGEEGDPGEDRADRERVLDVADEVPDEGAEGEEADEQEGEQRRERGAEGVRLGRPEAELLLDHRLRPQVVVARDDVDAALAVVALEALAGDDLADLLTLALGHEPDVAELLAPRLLALLAGRARAEVVAHRHAEAVGDEVRAAEDDDDRRVEVGALDAGDDGERRDR